MYYGDKTASLRDLFGAKDITIKEDSVSVDGKVFPVVDDVIIMLPPERLPAGLREVIGTHEGDQGATSFASDIQRSFGSEWQSYATILPEHEQEFADYFDLVDLASLADSRVADLGCGSGRWATFVAPHCKEIVVSDFSDAVLVARRNLRGHPNTIFIMADVLDLPFRQDAFDFAYCLGVLHHLPVDALQTLRSLSGLSQRWLVYLYYALDNRPLHFRVLLGAVTRTRELLARLSDERLRTVTARLIALLVYWPAAKLGTLLRPLGADRWLPLAEAYRGKSLRRLEQDAYDRFFTSIEQRFTREQITSLEDTFDEVMISERKPYWHFLCRR